MSAFDLPTSVKIGGEEFRIRYGWRAIIDILVACSDPELDEDAKVLCMLQIFYPNWNSIPSSLISEACEKACNFIDCGQKSDGKAKPKMFDWKQDGPIIIPEINEVAGLEIRNMPDIHWWTFWGWFMGIGDGLFSSILHIRQKKSKKKKLETWEQEFYSANKALIDLKKIETIEEREEKERIFNWLKFN